MRERMLESSWRELMSRHPIRGNKESLKIARDIFEFGYNYAWRDMCGFSTGLIKLDELLAK